MAVRFALPVGDRPVLSWRSGAPLVADVDGLDDTLGPLASAIYVLPPVPSTG